MKKYIVKNCKQYDNYFWEVPSCNKGTKDCQNIKDCELKKIIEQCKQVVNCKKVDKISKTIAQKVLSMVKIKEV